ncbi:MAG: ATPase domain-containing protein [Thermoplasmata archaeon]
MVNEKERIKTHIIGFDNMLKGGIPKGHIVLVCGGPGTYKSSITLNSMINNANKEGIKGVYISLEESKESLMETAGGLGLEGWDHNKILIADVSKLRLIKSGVDRTKNWINILENYIRKRIDEGFDVIAIDSMSALYSLADLKNPRKELFQFYGFLKGLNVTVLLINEFVDGEQSFGKYGEDFLSDGVIHLKYHHVSETEIQLWIRCVKMRQVKHSQNYFALLHEKGNFQIARVISER